jgi:hypothetical protein
MICYAESVTLDLISLKIKQKLEAHLSLNLNYIICTELKSF